MQLFPFIVLIAATVLNLNAVCAAEPAGDQPQRRILYYRNPMGLPDTSPVPKKDQMGMDYIPVYADEADATAHQIKISPDKIQKLGVRTAPARLRILTRTLRAVGTVQVDERRLYYVSPRFEGWIEQLFVNTVGQTVRANDPMMVVYSPDIIAAEKEYVLAAGPREATGGTGITVARPQLMEDALQRLRVWDLPEEEIQRLKREGKPSQSFTLRSPASGIVLEKHVVQGMRFMPGEALYHIADLSTVWIVADIFEQDLSLVQLGQTATVRLTAWPERTFTGKVTFIYPMLRPETRTAQIRIELSNPDGLLKPAMYASVELAASPERKPVLTIPNSAVIYSGTRQVVLLDRGEGRFQPREVKLGLSGDGEIQVLDGLAEGDTVVTAANFLIDAESNLRAALESFGNPGTAGATPAESTSDHSHQGH